VVAASTRHPSEQNGGGRRDRKKLTVCVVAQLEPKRDATTETERNSE